MTKSAKSVKSTKSEGKTPTRSAHQSLASVKDRSLRDPEVRAEYEALADEFEMARELVAARSRAGLTQAEVATRMGTTQSVIARLEGGKQPPSLRTVQRYAQAVGCRVVLRLE